MILAISIDKALDSVFARVALEAARTESAPAVGCSQSAALRTLARDILRGFAARLGRRLRSADFDSDDEIVTLELDVDSDSALAPVAGSVLCSALCLSIMAALHSDPSSAAQYNSQAEAELAILLAGASGRITPCAY